jgi:hypothetical protein
VKTSKPLAFVALAFVVGATISQASFAFADDSSTNPFRAIWQAISELQTRTDSLQSQINDLKAMKGTVAPDQIPGKVADPSVALEIGGGEAGQTLIQVIAKNSGPEVAVGVKLSTYYLTSLFKVNSIDGVECTDQARGIIECYLGTLEAGSEAKVTIDATPLTLGQQAVIASDISSITGDANPTNNHTETVFVTSSAPVAIQPSTPTQPPAQQPAEQPAVQQPSEQNQRGNSTQTTNTTQVTNTTQSGSAEQPAMQQGNETQAGQSTAANPGSNQTSSEPSENSGASGSGSSGSSESASSGESSAPNSSDSGSSGSTRSNDSGTSSSGESGSGGDSGGSGNATTG